MNTFIINIFSNLVSHTSEKVEYVTNKEDYEILKELDDNNKEDNKNMDISSEQIERGLDELDEIDYEKDEDENGDELLVEEIKADKMFSGKSIISLGY